MSPVEICKWLQETQFGTSLRESTLAFPVVEGTHLLGIAISVGALFVLDLRLAGWLFRRQSVTGISRSVMPIALFGFAVMFVTGALLFWCQALKAWGSIFFKIKLVLLLLAGINALAFELTVRKNVAAWDRDPTPPFRARLAGILGLVIWASVICAGRTMAYNF